MRDSLRLQDLSDREFLLVMHDNVDADGWVDSLQIANVLDLRERKIASSRLSWLARWGAVEREIEQDEHGSLRHRRNGKPVYTQRWRLTDIGWQLATGQIRKTIENQLEKADDAQMLAITHWLATRSTAATTDKLMQREWTREHLLRR